MAYLIDSSVFITLERRGEHLDALRRLVAGEPFAMSSISVSELLVGTLRATPPNRRIARSAVVEAIIEWVPIVPFDLRVARTHAALSVNLAGSGRSIGSHDLIIAATAVTHGYAVLTDNAREFQRVPGLDVVQPDW